MKKLIFIDNIYIVKHNNNKMIAENIEIIENIDNDYLYGKFKSLYPDINPTTIDKDLLKDMIFNIINEDCINVNNIKNEMTLNINNLSGKTIAITDTTKQLNQNKFNIELIKQNILMADEIIPEMSIPSNLIYIGGKINGINTNIMIDTGATNCVIFKSVVEKCGLDYLIDSSSSFMVQGAHGMKSTLGKIWFLDIDLKINKDQNQDQDQDQDQWISVPISVDIIDDSETIKANQIIKEYEDKINHIIKTNKNMDTDNDPNNISHEIELILGMGFLKSYRANIDFSSMTITLNKNIKIKFN